MKNQSIFHLFYVNKPIRVVSLTTRLVSFSYLFLNIFFLSIYGGLCQTSVKISLPLDRTVFQQSSFNNTTFQLAGQVKFYNPSSSNPAPEYQIESLNKNGGVISISQNWTNAGINYSATGFFNKTITLSTGWYRITVRYNGTNTNAVKVGIGEVIFAAGQSNAQGVELGGGNGGIPDLGTNYDCITTVNENCWCLKTYKFPVFNQMEYTATDGFMKVAPNGNQTLWCYQALGKRIVDKNPAVVTPVVIFNAGSGGSGIDNWKVSSENENNTTVNPMMGVLNCDYNNPDPSKFPQWGSEGPEGHPYRGLKTSLNYYGGMLGTRGVIWHQGESETKLRLENSPDASNYQSKLQAIMNATRVHFSTNLGWAISRVSKIQVSEAIRTDNSVKSDQVAVKISGDATKTKWGAYYSDEITDRLSDNTHFNANGLSKLAELYDTGNFTGNTAGGNQGGDILTLTPVDFNNRQSLAVNVTNPTTNEITMTVSGVYSAYYWVSNEGKITDSPSNKRTQSITVNNTGTDRWRCYVVDSKGNVAITQEVGLPVSQASVLTSQCPTGTFTPVSDKITCNEISGWVFRGDTQGEFGAVDIYVDGQYKNRITANSSKDYGMYQNDEGYIYSVPTSASWRDGINHVVSVRQCNSTISFASTTLNCPVSTDISITNQTGLTNVSSTGGTGTFVVNSTNSNWTVTTGGISWITVSPTTGSNGATTVSVAFQNNPSSARNATLTIKDSNVGATRFVDVNQLAASSSGITCDNGTTPFSVISASYSNQRVYFHFNANNLSSTNWAVKQGSTTIINGSINPVTSNTLDVYAGTLGAGTYDFVLSGASCTGTASKSFTVAGTTTSSLSLNQSSWSPSSVSSSQNVNVTSNVGWSVSSSDISWLTVSPTSGSNNGLFTMNATANSSTSLRTGTITVSGTDVTPQTISVTQTGTGSGNTVDRTEAGIASDDGANNPGGEGEVQAFDNTSNTKWLVFNSIGNVAYDFANEDTYAISRYTVTSANDEPLRDPKNWNLQGSNDGLNWTTVDSQNNQYYGGRFETKTFNISNTTAYKQYRLNVTANNGSTLLQISEIQMFGPAGGASCIIPNSPSISTSSSTSPANLTATGCSGSITWSNGQTINPLTGVSSGTYTATCTVNNCTSGPSNSITISSASGSCPTYSNPQWFHWDNASSSLWFAHYGPTGKLYAATDANPATPALTRQRLLNSGVTPTLASCFLDGTKQRIASDLSEIEMNLEVYPNPTNGKIKVGFTLQKDENVWFNLYDTQGKNLQLSDYEGKSGRNIVEFDLQNYPVGAYFIDLQYNQKREIRKVMKVN